MYTQHYMYHIGLCEANLKGPPSPPSRRQHARMGTLYTLYITSIIIKAMLVLIKSICCRHFVCYILPTFLETYMLKLALTVVSILTADDNINQMSHPALPLITMLPPAHVTC